MCCRYFVLIFFVFLVCDCGGDTHHLMCFNSKCFVYLFLSNCRDFLSTSIWMCLEICFITWTIIFETLIFKRFLTVSLKKLKLNFHFWAIFDTFYLNYFVSYYHNLIKKVVVPELKKTNGNEGTFTLERQRKRVSAFATKILWEL